MKIIANGKEVVCGGGGSTGDLSIIDRCVWITWAGSDLDIFKKDQTNYAGINEFLGHTPIVSANNVGLILVDDKLYWSKFDITAVTENYVAQTFTQDPILIGPTDSSGSSLAYENVYSSKETCIGTWFGKPLYRKTYYGTLTDISNNLLIDSSMSKANTNRKTLCSIYGSVMYSGSNVFYPIPFISNSGGDTICTRLHDDGLHLFVIFKNGTQGIAPMTISTTIEYTKTTD